MRIFTTLVIAGCVFVAPILADAQSCGDADVSGDVNASDALITLVTGVGAGDCPECICDVNSSGEINATDGLEVLQFGVGQPVVLNCILCATTTTTTTTTTTSTTTTTLPCMPMSLSGNWSLRVTLLTDCDPLEPAQVLPIVLAEDGGGNITIVSPQVPFNDFMMVRTDCSVPTSFNENEDGGTTFYTGTLELGSSGDTFSGVLSWDFFIGPFLDCSGTERWEGTRQ